MSTGIEVKCRGPHCGRTIVWARDEKGTMVPLESAPTYEVIGVEVSSHANRFSSSKPKPGVEQP